MGERFERGDMQEQVFVNHKTGKAIVVLSDGSQIKARLRKRPILCGRQCKGCPHGLYVYAVWRQGSKMREQYMGKIDQEDIKR